LNIHHTLYLVYLVSTAGDVRDVFG
jgi:hypothetical protein